MTLHRIAVALSEALSLGLEANMSAWALESSGGHGPDKNYPLDKVSAKVAERLLQGYKEGQVTFYLLSDSGGHGPDRTQAPSKEQVKEILTFLGRK